MHVLSPWSWVHYTIQAQCPQLTKTKVPNSVKVNKVTNLSGVHPYVCMVKSYLAQQKLPDLGKKCNSKPQNTLSDTMSATMFYPKFLAR
jgi:hypothetical protein